MRERVVVQPNAGLDFATLVALNLFGGPLNVPQLPPDGGLMSEPFIVRRSLLDTMGRLKVPETCRAVLFGNGGAIYDIGPGIHSLHFCVPGPLFGRLVDTSLRYLEVRLSGVRTADAAEVQVEVGLQFQVSDPVTIVGMHDPLKTLRTAFVGTVQEHIRLLTHAALLGGRPGSEQVVLARLERFIRLALHQDETLDGFRVWQVKIAAIEGDREYLEMVRRAEVAQLQLMAQGTELQVQQLLAEKERILALTQAQAERERRQIESQMALDSAQVEAQVFASQTPARVFQTEWETLHLVNAREMERIRALGQTGQALAVPFVGGMSNAPFAYAPDSPGRDQALLQVVGRLSEALPGDGSKEQP